MTSTEFDEWFRYHCAAFEGLSDWMDRKVQKDPDALRLWGKSVRRVSLRCAKQATEAMLSDEALQPEGFSRHPAKVNTFAKERGGIEGTKRRQSFVDGTEVYDCATCRDEGTITVFAVEAMEAMRDGRFDWRDSHRLVGVACNCGMGWASHTAVQWRKGQLPVFDAKKMVLAVCGNDKASVAALAAFCGVAVPEYSIPTWERPASAKAAVEAHSGVAIKSLGQLTQRRAEGDLTPPKPKGAPTVMDYDESEASVGEEHGGAWHPGMEDKF